MARKKLLTVKVKESNRRVLSVLIVVFMVAFLLRFEVIATAFNSLLQLLGIDTSVDQIMNVAVTIANLSIGALLLWGGVSLLSVPFFGVGFAVIGGVLLAYEAVKLYNATNSSKQISEPL